MSPFLSRAIILLLAALPACSKSNDEIRPDDGAPADPAAAGDGEGATGAALEQSGTRLKRRVLTASDGARASLGWYDTERKEACAFVKASDGKLRCLPQSIATMTGPYYSDVKCTRPLAAVAHGCAAPAIASEIDAACGAAPKYTIYKVTGRVTSDSNVFTRQGDSCLGYNLPNGPLDYYATGAEIAASTFVSATESDE
jgi:hypothetical protein